MESIVAHINLSFFLTIKDITTKSEQLFHKYTSFQQSHHSQDSLLFVLLCAFAGQSPVFTEILHRTKSLLVRNTLHRLAPNDEISYVSAASSTFLRHTRVQMTQGPGDIKHCTQRPNKHGLFHITRRVAYSVHVNVSYTCSASLQHCVIISEV